MRQQLEATNGLPQSVPIPGGAIGSSRVRIGFATAPSAGTVSVSMRAVGSLIFSPLPDAQALSVTSGEAFFRLEEWAAELRITFAGLVGGTAPVVWLQTSVLPDGLFTGTTNPRLRVDEAQTGFFEGREFRTFKEWTAATTATYVIRATVPINIILFELGIELDAGSARIETVLGGAPGGTFDEVLPIIPTNTMTEKPQPPYAAQVVLEAGGTLAGGTLLDPLRAKTSDNSNFAASVGAAAGAERGVGPNIYYFRLTLTGVTGVFKARWEERP